MDIKEILLEYAGPDTLYMKLLDEKKVNAAVLRLDRIHPVISGNKWFKLKYYLEEAENRNAHTIITFGGAWSNHIVATACAARQSGFKSIGLIRSEPPRERSGTIRMAESFGMEMEFIGREKYARRNEASFMNALDGKYDKAYTIPEGGAGEKGIRGSTEILRLTANPADFTHILCCLGTGTMFTGLAISASAKQQVVGIAVLKGMQEYGDTLISKTLLHITKADCSIIHDYHFGGYARKNQVLLDFMNDLFRKTKIPTDFVYTGKLFYAFESLLIKDFFPVGSNVLIVHSGGLQGNASLQDDALEF